MRRPKTHYTLFPELLDSTLSRREGRRLRIEEAIENPDLEEIRLAAEKLELDTQIEKYATYPRRWWNKGGMILVEAKKSKTETMRELSNEIKEFVRPAIKRKLAQKKADRTRIRTHGKPRIDTSRRKRKSPKGAIRRRR